MLKQSEAVARRVGEVRCQLRRVHPHRLYDDATMGDDFLYRRINVVHHDRNHKTRIGDCLTPPGPHTADLSYPIIERSCAVVASADIPAEYSFIKRSRLLHVDSRHFDITDLAVTKSRMLHNY